MSIAIALLAVGIVALALGLPVLSFGNTATTPSSLVASMRVKRTIAELTINYPTPPSVQINPNDILVWNASGGYVAPVSTVTWDTDVQTTRRNALTVFVGIALGQKNAVDARTGIMIPVLTEGIATFPCAALGSAANPGALVSPAAQGVHNLSDFLMAITTDQASAFGSIITLAPIGSTFITFQYSAALLYGQLQAP